MKALVYRGVEQLAIEEVDEVKDIFSERGEVIVRVKATGICGSDLHAYHGHDERRPPPLILGHEVAGIAEQGRYQGKRVTVNPLVHCGSCQFCLAAKENLCVQRQILSLVPRQGGFAERIIIPERNLYEIPDDVSSDVACLVEPLATSYHAIVRMIQMMERPFQGEKIMVIGGGAIGMGCWEILKALGVPTDHITLVEKNGKRLEHIRSLFSGEFLFPEEFQGESSYQVVFDAVGNQVTHRFSSRAVKPGGIIVRIGLEQSNEGYDIRKHTLQEIVLLGCYTYTPRDFEETSRLLFSGRIGEKSSYGDGGYELEWKQNMPLDEGALAFSEISRGKTPFSKIVLVQ